MSITDQKRFVVTQEQTEMTWGGGFWCNLCGYEFTVGDGCRWIYSGGRKMPNVFVCDTCDGDDVADRAEADYAKSKEAAIRWCISESAHNKEARRVLAAKEKRK